MIVLSIDTSTRLGSMGIYESNPHSSTPLAQKEWEGSHSEVITNHLIELLSQAQIKLSDIKEIHLGIGPGSFTGLRVAVNLVRAISYSFSTPIFATNSLAGLAWPHAKMMKTLSLMKAQQNIVYVSSHSSLADNFEELLAPKSMSYDNTVKYIETLLTSSPLTICGLINENLKEKIAREGLPEVTNSTPKSNSLVEHNFFHRDKMRPISWKTLIPLYIRASTAEEKMKRGLLKPLPD